MQSVLFRKVSEKNRQQPGSICETGRAAVIIFLKALAICLC